MAPGLKRKSGVRYRLNRWREEQLAKAVESHTETWCENMFDSIKPMGRSLRFLMGDTLIFLAIS